MLNVDDGPFTGGTHSAVDNQGISQVGHSHILMNMPTDQQGGLTVPDESFKGLAPGMIFPRNAIQASPWRRMRNQNRSMGHQGHQPLPYERFPEGDSGPKRYRYGSAGSCKMNPMQHHIAIVEKKNVLFQGKLEFNPL